jgi:transcriptional regulator with XRE-family HTH domain
MSIGDRIKDLRWDARINQTELARRAGIAKNTMSQIELGNQEPSIKTLEKIARGLGVPVSDLLKEPAPLAEASATGHELIFRQAYESAEDFDAVFERALSEARAHRAFYLSRGMRLSVIDDGKSVALYAVEHGRSGAREPGRVRSDG